MKAKLLVCGASGFIGRNLFEYFSALPEYEVYGTSFKNGIPGAPPIVKADLTDPADVDGVIRGMDIVIQAAAVTSGAGDIVTRPYLHVTDNAVMNAHIFRACHEHKVKRVIYFSCTSMYEESPVPAREEDFNGRIHEKYFGVGWTKVYNEKMCEFYARLGPGKYTAVRHSNIYGPHDKFDLDRSHVFGATVTKVLSAPENGKITVWGDGSDERDLLYINDLVEFIALALKRQEKPFELVNAGSGRSVSVRELIAKIIEKSGRTLGVEYDLSKPAIGFKLKLNIERAEKIFGWRPATSLEEGIEKTIAWHRAHYALKAGA